MAYYVSSGTLNRTPSLTHSLTRSQSNLASSGIIGRPEMSSQTLADPGPEFVALWWA